jgi:hypothetical protein
LGQIPKEYAGTKKTMAYIIGLIDFSGNVVNSDKLTKDAANLEEVVRRKVGLDKGFFGHDPTWPVSWAGNKASSAIVAHRFRMVARGLGGGRRMLFRCGCPGAGAGAEVVARTNADMPT